MTAAICAGALFLPACGDGGDVGVSASTPAVSPTESLNPTATARADEQTRTCTNAELGYAVLYPASWYTSDGSERTACSHFDPDPITRAPGPERGTAITLYLSQKSYQQVVASFGQVLSRDGALVDGREAVTVTDRAGGEGNVPEGTVSYTWVVNLGGRALLGVTRQGPNRDYTRNAKVLDLIMGSLDFAVKGADPTTVARVGAGPGYQVTAEVLNGEVCLRAQSNGRTGAPTCVEATPLRASIAVAELAVPGGRPVVAGLADPDIARVLTATADSRTSTFRPTEVAGVSSRAWVVPLAPEDVATVIGYTSDRRMEVVLDGTGSRSTVLGDLTDFPKQKSPSPRLHRLTAVGTGLHAGYDRITFRFRDGAPGFEVGYTERPVRADASAEDLVIAGHAILQVRLNKASGQSRAGSASATSTGPMRVAFPAGFAVTELVRIGDDEGVLTWVVGLRERLPFRVDARASSIVLEVRHPASHRRVSRTE